MTSKEKYEIKIRLTKENRDKLKVLRFKTDVSFNAWLNYLTDRTPVEVLLQEFQEGKVK